MSCQNPKLDKLIGNVRFAESKPIDDSSVRDMIQLADARRCSSRRRTWPCRRT